VFQLSAQIQWLEQTVGDLVRRMTEVLRRLARLEQQIWAAAAGGGGGGGSSSCYVCVPSASVAAATGAPGSGTPGSLGGQTIYQVSSGAYTSVTTSGTIYNVSPSSSLASGKVTLLGQNPDGTYTALSQVC
jgi:hypothetical protein